MGPSSNYQIHSAPPSGQFPPLQGQAGVSTENTPPPGSMKMPSSTAPEQEQPPAFGIFTTTPPPLDPHKTMQRGDEITTIQRMLGDNQTSTLVLTGAPGAGKSTLAILLYRRLLMAQQQGMRAPRHVLWFTLDSYTTLPDLIITILRGLGNDEPGLFLLKPEQQISTLLRTLRRSQEPALIILDQFEAFLHPEVRQGVAGRGAFRELFNLLQTDLGASRIVLTCFQSPFEDKGDESRVRACLISRITLPEGLTLLQQLGIQCSPEDLSLIWQRCTGHTLSLVLFNALVQLSGTPVTTMLHAPDYQAMWGGDLIANLLGGVAHYVNPIQQALLQVLSLFYAPTSLDSLTAILQHTSLAQNVGMAASQLVAACEHEVATLVQLGLIQPVSTHNGVITYTLHSILRQFIHEHFVESSQEPVKEEENDSPISTDPIQVELAAGHVQVANYYQQLSATACPPHEQRTSLLEIEPIVRAIRHYCLGWHWQQACELLFKEHLHESMVQWGAWNALLGLYTAMLPPMGILERHEDGLVSSHIAMLHGRLGEHQQSRSYSEQALDALQQTGDIISEAMTLNNQGELLRSQGNYEAAAQNFERALALLEQQPDDQLHCILLHNQGLLSQYNKQFEQAMYLYTEALQIASHLGPQYYTGMILTNLGMLLYESEEKREAMAILLAALRIREMANDPAVPLLERFLIALEQKMGSESYAMLCSEALEIQPLVFSRFAPSDMRQ